MPDCARGLHGVVWSLGGEGSLRLFGRTFVEPNAVKFTCTNNVRGLSVWGSMLLHVVGFLKVCSGRSVLDNWSDFDVRCDVDGT